MEALRYVPRDKDTLDHFQLLLSLEGKRGDFERDDLLPVGSCSWL